MLHQENNNEERRLKSKGLTGLGPIKTSDVWLVESVGEERIERKKKKTDPLKQTLLEQFVK